MICLSASRLGWTTGGRDKTKNRTGRDNRKITTQRKARMTSNQPTKNGPIYENCTILAPDGVILCRTSQKKLKWYLDRELAEPVVIKLKFEPSGRKNSEDTYYLSDKENRCVVCGTDFDLNMHHVVPRCYRRHFPDELKNHASHDVVATCSQCHEVYETHAMRLKIKIGEEYGCPIGVCTVDPAKLRVRKAAHALRNHDDVIPEIRRQFLRSQITQYLGRDINESDLVELSDIDAVDKGVDNCQAVVDQVDPQEFTERWRFHFISVMEPRFLPLGWDANRKES
jgi:hypothetical protein